MKIVLRNGQFRLEANDGRFIQRVQTVTLVREDGTRQKFALAIRPRRGFRARELEECPKCGGLTRGDCPDCTGGNHDAGN